MSDELPAAVRVRELPGGACYRLPAWKGGTALGIGCVLLIPGLLFTAFGVIGALLILNIGPADFGMQLLMLLVPFLALAVGVPILLFAFWMMAGQTVITLGNGLLRRTYVLGPLPLYTSHRPVSAVRRLVVVSDGKQKQTELVAAGAEGKPISLGWMYPYDWLWYLAHDLAGRADAPIEVAAEWSDFTGERAEPPVRSRIAVTPDDGGVTFTVPRAGFRSAALFLLVFGVIWCGIVVLIGSLIPGGGLPHPAELILIPFFLVGLLLIVAGCHVARRRVILSVRDGVLLVWREGLFGRSYRARWPRDQLAAVEAVQEWRKQTTHDQNTHTTSTTYRLVTLLRVRPVSGNGLSLEGQYGMHGTTVPAEWEWLATRLRQELNLAAE